MICLRVLVGSSTLWIASDGPFKYGRVTVVSLSVLLVRTDVILVDG